MKSSTTAITAAAALMLGGCADATPLCRDARALASLPRELEEASGVVWSPQGFIWSHNDSGGDAVLFAVDTMGRMIGRVSVSGARNRDWEDIADGPCGAGRCLYIADTGDNDEERDDVVIYRVREPDPSATATETAARIPVRLPAGPRDIEALFTRGDALYLVTKGRNHPIELYRLPAAGGTAQLVQQLAPQPGAPIDQVTAAAAVGDLVAVRTYARVHLYQWSGDSLQPLLDGAGIDITQVGEPQGEGIDIMADGSVLLATEAGAGGVPASFARLQCALPSLSGE